MNARQLRDDLFHKSDTSQYKPILVSTGGVLYQAQMCYDTDNFVRITLRMIESGQERCFVMTYDRVAHDLDEHGMIVL